MDDEAARKFEDEVAWCLEQLRLGLESGNLSEKQAKEYRTASRALQNPKNPLPKKRQVMRMSFGDYRAKMAEEDKKVKLGE